MKTISYIKHLHKAIFIVLLMLALVACGDGTPPAPTPGDGNGNPTGDGGGDPGETQNVELRYPSDSSEQIKTYAEGRRGFQRHKVYYVFSRTTTSTAGGTRTEIIEDESDNTYPDQLEEVVLGNAMRASEAQKAELRKLTTMATFPLALFTEANERQTLFSTSQADLGQQLKLLYNEATGEVKFSIKVEERPPVGHPGTDPNDRRWTTEERTAERYQIQFTSGTGTLAEVPPNAIYRLAIRKSSTDTTFSPLKATGIDLVFPEPEIGDEWYVIGELHKDPQCGAAFRFRVVDPKADMLTCESP